MDKGIWNLLFSYYKESYIIVCSEGKKSDRFKTTEGVKQGGILSPFLFNFFINDILEEALDMNIGARIGNFNTSIIAYCDDLLLSALNEMHMNRLLECCHNFAEKWKMEFNASKSVSFSYSSPPVIDFKLGTSSIPKSEGFIYLGLPIGNDGFIENFILSKFKKCEKALYSLRSLGCKPNHLNPRSISFVYKQFCQSIIRFGLDNLFLKRTFINQLNVRQNTLIKNVLGVKHFARSKVLLNELKVEPVLQLYLKHKLFGLKQFKRNNFSKMILDFLIDFYQGKPSPKQSFISQLKEIETYTGIVLNNNISKMVESIDGSFQCNDLDLRSQVKNILDNFNTDYSFLCVKSLNECLKVDFGIR